MTDKVFACSCGSIRFKQSVIARAIEVVELYYNESAVNPVSIELEPIDETQLEHFNEFICVVCGENHVIQMKEGKYSIN